MKFEVNPCSIAEDEDFTCLLTDSMSPSPLYQGATQSSRDLSDPMAVAVAVEGSASKMTKSWRLGARRRCSLDLSLSHSRLERGVEAVEDAKFGLEKISQAGIGKRYVLRQTYNTAGKAWTYRLNFSISPRGQERYSSSLEGSQRCIQLDKFSSKFLGILKVKI